MGQRNEGKEKTIVWKWKRREVKSGKGGRYGRRKPQKRWKGVIELSEV